MKFYYSTERGLSTNHLRSRVFLIMCVLINICYKKALFFGKEDLFRLVNFCELLRSENQTVKRKQKLYNCSGFCNSFFIPSPVGYLVNKQCNSKFTIATFSIRKKQHQILKSSFLRNA